MSDARTVSVTFPDRDDGQDISAKVGDGLEPVDVAFAAWAIIDLALKNAHACGCHTCGNVIRRMTPVQALGPKLNGKAQGLQ